MAVRIVFLGRLQDLAGASETEVAAPLDWRGLLQALGPQLASDVANPRVQIACAGAILTDKTALYAQDGNEIALLPPVSGG